MPDIEQAKVDNVKVVSQTLFDLGPVLATSPSAYMVALIETSAKLAATTPRQPGVTLEDSRALFHKHFDEFFNTYVKYHEATK